MTKIAHLQRKREQDSAVVERNDEKLTRVARATAKAGTDVARESVEVAQGATEALAQRTAGAAEDLYEMTRQLAEDSPEIGHAFTELLGEQTRQSMDTLSAFGRAVNWTDVAQAQSKLIADSFVRISHFNARYGQFLLRGMTAAPRLARR